jgi:aspartate carbamoyltransferase catalytic subunit
MWDRKDLVSINDLTKKDIEMILDLADHFKDSKGKKLDSAKGYILGNVFFEPSTRTQRSFQAAMYRLGGNVLTHKDIGSSREKGESKEDTIRVFEQYCDVMVIRDPGIGSIKNYADILSVPVINAGDGSNEHPTQSLLDLCTIRNELKRLENLKVVLVGDLKYGRTVHSLVKALEQFDNNSFFGVSPESLGIPEEFRNKDYEQVEFTDLNEALRNIKPDIVYATRVQKERLSEGEEFSYEINSKTMDVLPKESVIMHPLPRVNELNPEIDSDPRVIPFKQAGYGLRTRMAVLAILLGKS